MSFKTIVTLLLLSCLSATVTSLGVTKEPLQEGRALPMPPTLTITEVRWVLIGTSTTVQICTESDITPGLPTLTYDDGTLHPVTVDGIIDDAKLNCANFLREVVHKPNQNSARYELIVTETDHPGNFLGRGVTTFPITVRTTLLTCGGLGITKITWSADEKLVSLDCLEQPRSVSNVCYHNKDLTGSEFCFTVTDEGGKDVNVCLNGPTDSSPASTGIVTMDYFYYEPAPDATLSLVMETAGLTQMRAIVRRTDDPENPGTPGDPGEATVHGCSGTECTFVAYEPKFATYQVCAEAMDVNSETLETAITSFKDLNLHVFDGGSQKSTLLESVFANGLEGLKYTANLYQEAPPDMVDGTHLSTSNLDCTSVMDGHACFGFLDMSAGVGIVYQTLSAVDGSNTIIAPFTIP